MSPPAITRHQGVNIVQHRVEMAVNGIGTGARKTVKPGAICDCHAAWRYIFGLRLF